MKETEEFILKLSEIEITMLGYVLSEIISLPKDLMSDKDAQMYARRLLRKVDKIFADEG